MEVQRDWVYIHRLEADREWLRFINAGLLAACEAMLERWDEYIDDDGSMNPHDHRIDEPIDAIRTAVAKAKGGPP